MLHVAILFEYSTLNGGERSMLSVIDTLQSQRAIRFTAMAPPTGPLADELRRRSVPLCPIEPCTRTADRGRDDERLGVLAAHIGNTAPDIVHANSLSMCRLTGRLLQFASRTPAPRDSSICSKRPRFTGHIRDIMRLNAAAIAALNRSDRLAAVSAATRDALIGQGVEAWRCCVLHNGVDTLEFCPGTDRLETRARVLPAIPRSAFVVLNIGQICLRKGQLDLATGCLAALPDVPDLHLVLVGRRHSDKPESVEFDQGIDAAFRIAGAADRLHRTGLRSDIPELLHSADVLVHTARQEPFGRTLLESAACGLPIIATDVGGTRELLRPEIDAILVPPAEPAAVSCAIARLAGDAALQRQLSESARQRVCTEFSVEGAASALVEFWQETITA